MDTDYHLEKKASLAAYEEARIAVHRNEQVDTLREHLRKIGSKGGKVVSEAGKAARAANLARARESRWKQAVDSKPAK